MMGQPPALHEPDSHNFADLGSSDRLTRREGVRPIKGQVSRYGSAVTLDCRGAMLRPERTSG